MKKLDRVKVKNVSPDLDGLEGRVISVPDKVGICVKLDIGRVIVLTSDKLDYVPPKRTPKGPRMKLPHALMKHAPDLLQAVEDLLVYFEAHVNNREEEAAAGAYGKVEVLVAHSKLEQYRRLIQAARGDRK